MPHILQTRPRCCLVLFCLLLWLPGLFTIPPSDRDESRFALATRQMIETGDYVRIMNGDVPRNRKPIGIHWLQAPFALAARAAGVARANPIWPYRMPSLLGGMLAVLATFEIGLALGNDKRSALLGAGMLAACVILTVEAHIAKTDAALLGATTLAQTNLARAWMAPGSMRRRHAAVFWLAIGAGILIKGPITPMVSGLTAATLVVWRRRAAWLGTLHAAWGVPLMLAVVLPWLLAIGLATHGAFFADAVGGDLGRKLAGGADSHGGVPGLHLLLLPLLSFPATAWVLRAAPAAWAERRSDAAGFLLAWVLPAWLVFEAVPTKLPHYPLPLYPGLFLLAARYGFRPVSAWYRRASMGLVWVAAAVLAVGALALPIWLHGFWPAGAAVMLLAVLVALLVTRDRPVLALLAAIPLYAVLLQAELPRLTPLWIAPRLQTALAGMPGYDASGSGLVAAGFAEPSLPFLAGPHMLLMPTGQSAADALAHGRIQAVVTAEDRAAFQAQAARLKLAPAVVGQVAGFNYSRGKQVELTIFSKLNGRGPGAPGPSGSRAEPLPSR